MKLTDVAVHSEFQLEPKMRTYTLTWNFGSRTLITAITYQTICTFWTFYGPRNGHLDVNGNLDYLGLGLHICRIVEPTNFVSICLYACLIKTFNIA